jgi:hypothetical protein
LQEQPTDKGADEQAHAAANEGQAASSVVAAVAQTIPT